MHRLLTGLFRSFPVQLLLLHLRTNFPLLLVWVLLAMMMGGVLGPRLGMQYLFLDPEYLDMSGFWPFLIVGMAFGFFTMSWNLSTYLLVGRWFPFLASLSRPFFKFCINNALLPLGVLAFYVVLIAHFLALEGDGWEQAEAISGLLLGLALSLFLYALYFNFTNRDISYYLPGYRLPPPNLSPGQGASRTAPLADLGTGARARIIGHSDNPLRVRTYLNNQLKVRLVRSVAHYDSSVLSGIFRQNHGNALLLQAATVLILALLGLGIDQPFFQIPAGASFLILFSLITASIGAITYWFGRWSFPVIVGLLVVVNWLTTTPIFRHGNQAYGLTYTAPARYSTSALKDLINRDTVNRDIAATLTILENWKAKHPTGKPPFFVICASGGGLTAALWATHVTQTLDVASGGRLLPATALMTGASGGMLGLGYLREAYLRDSALAPNANRRLDRISRDLLNPVSFSIVSNDLFLPFTRVNVNGRRYRRDRAYNFERELNDNTQGWLDKALGAYRKPEQRADIPLLFLTPSIVEDGRRLVISPQGVSYMTAPTAALRDGLPLQADAVEFRRLLADQGADSLRFLTGLRMNATYPYVLPLVNLPTQPVVRVMDAGYRDNYGIASATRFLTVFQNWIKANTSGVHLIQISAFRDKPLKTQPGDSPGVIEGLFSPVGVAGNILTVQILDQETLLGQLANDFGADFFHLYRFNYQPPPEDGLRTSVSLHLTEGEREQVLRGVNEPDFKRLKNSVASVLSSASHQ